MGSDNWAFLPSPVLWQTMVHRMMSLLPLMLLFSSATAMPMLFNETSICASGDCNRNFFKDMKYEKSVASQPGYQWDDAGGYCGSWAIQRATLAKGAWISQQQVRDHTSPGGGHDNEI